MSLIHLHIRRFLQQNVIESEFPFEIDSDASFLIKNETTAAEQVFTYDEVIDGTYDTWLNGAEGGVLEWRSNGLVLEASRSQFIRLKSNNGNPYLNDWDQKADLVQQIAVNMGEDWIITVIMDKELNGNNQRLNLAIRGAGNYLFALQLTSGGNGFIVIDRLTTSSGVPDYGFTYPTTDDFKLFTFYKRDSQFGMFINDVNTTLSTNATFYTWTEYIPENSISLGASYYEGKITNYQHLKVLTGDLSAIDLNAYNQAIMDKYGIT